MDSRPIEIAALGRPLYPGMLYDCRNDSFIPGITLWDMKTVCENIDVRRQPKTDLKISATDSLSDKANLLDVNASLKASFMGGLVEVGGSGKYLHDTKSSERTSRVTMHFSQTTRFEQLTMAEFSRITYQQVFDDHTATHVVTGVLYGAQAFMVFDHTTADHEDKQEVEGHLHVLIKKIPLFSIEGEAAVKLNERERKMADSISVTFHADYELDMNPTTYQEALQVYKDLPRLLREKEKDAVPVRVWLYPLSLLNDKAAKLVREINDNLVSKAERFLGDLGDVERRCRDLFGDRMLYSFLDLKDRLQMFQDLCSDYKVALQRALFRALPAIRDGTQEELLLDNILSAQYRSPFAVSNLNRWLDDVSTELSILSYCIGELNGIKVVTSAGLLNAILFNPDIDVVVCLSFTSLKYKDTYLEALKDFASSEAFLNLEQAASAPYSPQATQPWFISINISKTVRQNLSLFKSFSVANKNEQRMQFIIASTPDPSCPGVSIQLYEKGKLTDPKFQPVSKPPPPTVETQNAAVTMKLQKSPTGATLRFRVEYRMVKDYGARQGDTWETTDTTDAGTSFVLSRLLPGRQYDLRYKAVGAVGVSEVSESVQVQLALHARCGTLVGGCGGSEHIFADQELTTLKKIRVMLGSQTVDSIAVTLSNNKERVYGRQKTFWFQEFTFQEGECFRSLTLWPNRAKNRLGGLSFDILRRSGQIDTFCAKISNVGEPVHIDVCSGICCGVRVRSATDVDALGFIFLSS